MRLLCAGLVQQATLTILYFAPLDRGLAAAYLCKCYLHSREVDNAHYRATRCLRKTRLDRTDHPWLHDLVAAWGWRPRFHHRERKNGMRTAALAGKDRSHARQGGLDAHPHERRSLGRFLG